MSESKRWLAMTVWMSQTATSADETANQMEMTIYSGGSRDNLQFVGQVKRSGVDVSGFDFSYASGTGKLTVADNGSADLTEGDVVTVIGTFDNLA